MFVSVITIGLLGEITESKGGNRGCLSKFNANGTGSCFSSYFSVLTPFLFLTSLLFFIGSSPIIALNSPAALLTIGFVVM